MVSELNHELFETDAGANKEFRLIRPAVRIHTDSQGKIEGNGFLFSRIGFAGEIEQAIVQKRKRNHLHWSVVDDSENGLEGWFS